MHNYRCFKRVFKWIALQLMLLLSPFLIGQNIHFSQNYSAHLTLNPANTGRFNGDMRASSMYRSQGYQFSEAYNTFYLSFEKPFYVVNERINTGLYFSHDNSYGNSLPANLIYFNLSHEVLLTINKSLIVGLQMGYVHKMVSLAETTFPDQYNREIGRFDPYLPTSEYFETTTSTHLDVGFGVLYSHSFVRGVWSMGISLQRLNRPSESFFGIESRLPVRSVMHGKADINVGSSMFVMPSFIFVKQGEPTQTIGGANIGYTLNNNSSQTLKNIILGMHYRNGLINDAHALIFSVGATYANIKFITSYDYDISGLRTSSVRNASFEFSLMYTLPSTNLKKKIISCERY